MIVIQLGKHTSTPAFFFFFKPDAYLYTYILSSKINHSSGLHNIIYTQCHGKGVEKYAMPHLMLQFLQ